MSKGRITLTFPEMLIHPISIGLRRAEYEPCYVDIYNPQDFQEYNDSFATTPPTWTFIASIPETDIHGLLMWWTVDACKCTGQTDDGNIRLIVDLPEEPVRFKDWCMTALAINCNVMLVQNDIIIATGNVLLPDCKARPISWWKPWGDYEAEAVTGIGDLHFHNY